MAIRTKDELLSSINEKFEGDTSDEMLSLIEDISDTINDYDTKTKDSTMWKTKYEDNDKEWRKKYRDRFFSGNTDEITDIAVDEPEKKSPMTFDDLFAKK